MMQSFGWETSFCGFLQGQEFQKLSVPLGAHLLGIKKLDFLKVHTRHLLKSKTADNQYLELEDEQMLGPNM